MAGLIRREDIDEVRQRTDIKQVVDAYVTLKSAGIGSYKGLCPFHDERSPSFHIRPQVGRYHCFGCGESGDVIAFVQRMDHTSFSETVEKLAARIGYELTYEDGPGPKREDVGKRQRMLDAHKIAAEFFRGQLLSPGAAPGRQFLSERGFSRSAADHFGLGFAPQGWDGLLKHLRSKGFTEEELSNTGMFSQGSRGMYDRFRGRLVWPIRDIAGDTIGFGARRLLDDDKGPKYLNTPETLLYKKSQVLYGIDLAKREIAKQRQLIVVEGYTDVMACHLAGIKTAVATCGTAFGAEHVKISRRLLSDDGTGGEVIFTFDGDEAGQKAALKAFDEDQRFVAQTYVAVEPTGADPCDLRVSRGDAAVQELIDARRPLFEFAIKATLRKYNLDTVEGRVQALRASAPVVARIRDSAMRPAYSRELAGWLGMDPDEVSRAVSAASKQAQHNSRHNRQDQHGQQRQQGQQGQPQGGDQDAAQAPGESGPQFSRPDPRDPVTRIERDALEVVLQHPAMLSPEQWERFRSSRFTAPAHAAVHEAIRAAGTAGGTPAQWVEQVRQEVPDVLDPFVSELAVRPLNTTSPEALAMYCTDILNRLFELQITHEKAEKMGQLQRMDPSADPEAYQRLQRELMELEMSRRALRQDR
ncbi:MAG TPA: DNA primase [Arthrobacter sp.]|nr:DNA primase [Arthrobacter sp.]